MSLKKISNIVLYDILFNVFFFFFIARLSSTNFIFTNRANQIERVECNIILNVMAILTINALTDLQSVSVVSYKSIKTRRHTMNIRKYKRYTSRNYCSFL